MKPFSIIFISLLILSCSKDKKDLSDVLKFKLTKIEDYILLNGNKKEEIALENELIKTLNQIDKNGILTKAEIDKLSLHQYDKKRLEVLSDTIEHSFIDKFKLYIIDFYLEKLYDNNIYFDNVKSLAIKNQDNKINLFLTGNNGPIIPMVYLTRGDSAYKFLNKNRTKNPVTIDLDSIEFDNLYEPIKSAEGVFGYYMIPTGKGDTAFVIRNEDIIDAY